jgi:polygalacturonase
LINFLNLLKIDIDMNKYFVLFCFSIISFKNSFSENLSTAPLTDTIANLAAIIPGDTILQTAALQGAINACSTSGGGKVIVLPGTYAIGPITMKNNVNLYLDSGATLLGSTNMSDWTVSGSLLNLIGGKNLQNVSITGKGTINGSGAPWWAAYNANNAISRPRLIYLTSVTNFTVDGITLLSSPSFHLVPNQCVNVFINNVTITADKNSPNTDGIDPSYCRNVFITNCKVDVGDDCIAIKSGRINGALLATPSQDIVISNCTFLHGHGVSVGSETDNGVKNLFVSGCTFNGTTNGIRLKSGSGLGGLMQNLYYSNITMSKVTNPIVVDLAYSTSTTYPTDIPAVNGFYINNLTVTGASNAGSMSGLTTSLLQNINFSNIKIAAKTGLAITNASGVTLSNWTITVTSGSQIISTNVTGNNGF